MGGMRAWFLFAAAVDAAPGYLAQRLAEHGLAMAEFARTGRGVRTERDRAAGERVFYWFDKEVVYAERALERRADVAAAAAGDDAPHCWRRAGGRARGLSRQTPDDGPEPPSSETHDKARGGETEDGVRAVGR